MIWQYFKYISVADTVEINSKIIIIDYLASLPYHYLLYINMSEPILLTSLWWLLFQHFMTPYASILCDTPRYSINIDLTFYDAIAFRSLYSLGDRIFYTFQYGSQWIISLYQVNIAYYVVLFYFVPQLIYEYVNIHQVPSLCNQTLSVKEVFST